MKKYLLLLLTTAVFMSGGIQTASAADTDDFVYGRQLMTQEELTEHRSKMRNLKTEEEREQYRMQHHEMMKMRAQEKGVSLPEEPMPQGMGRGMGQGGGPGGGRP